MNLKLIADALEASEAEIVVSNLVDLTQARIAALVDLALRVPRALFAQRVQEIKERLNALARRPRFTVGDVLSLISRELPSHRSTFARPDSTRRPRATIAGPNLMWPAVRTGAQFNGGEAY
jgi:hypothetical protein